MAIDMNDIKMADCRVTNGLPRLRLKVIDVASFRERVNPENFSRLIFVPFTADATDQPGFLA